VQISEQEALFRYRPATDTVDLLVIHEGVSASDRKDKTLAGAKQIARRFLEKRRYLHLQGNPISWDLDDIQERLASGALAKDTTPQELELLEMILPRCVLERAGGFVDPKGRLSAYQLYRIEGFSKVVQLWNQLLSRAILEAMREPEKFAANTPLLDARTRDLWRVHAEKSRDWIRVAGDGLDFVIPITRAALDNAQAALSAELRGEDAPATSAYLGQLMPYLAGWSHSDDTLRLSLRPAGGVFHTRYWSNARMTLSFERRWQPMESCRIPISIWRQCARSSLRRRRPPRAALLRRKSSGPGVEAVSKPHPGFGRLHGRDSASLRLVVFSVYAFVLTPCSAQTGGYAARGGFVAPSLVASHRGRSLVLGPTERVLKQPLSS
jgi:hypothetical protein